LQQDKALKTENANIQELLHRRLTYISDEYLQKTLQHTIGFNDQISQKGNIFASYLEGKHHKYPGNNTISNSNKSFELIHIDIAGPFPEGLKGQRYYISFIDDYT
jgi:hypothetical protein